MLVLEIFEFLSVLFLGLLMGSLLTEAMVFVPLWKAMSPKDFLDSHADAKPIIYRYFKPMTILATKCTIITAVLHLYFVGPNLLEIFPGLVGVSLLVIYFAFFKQANDNFSNGSLNAETLPQALDSWAKWHWLRTVLGLCAFVVSILNIR